MSVQTTYERFLAVGFKGQVGFVGLPMKLYTYIVEAAAGIIVGRPVVAKTAIADSGGEISKIPYTVEYPDNSADAIIGIAVRNNMMSNAATSGDSQGIYADEDLITVLREGAIVVEAGEAVAADAAVYYVFAGATYTIGEYVKTAVAGETTIVPNARWHAGVAANALGRIIIEKES